jgi:restriction endonuclease Mrr
MAVSDFQTLMLPVLKQFSGSTERRSSEIRAPLATEFALTKAACACHQAAQTVVLSLIHAQ